SPDLRAWTLSCLGELHGADHFEGLTRVGPDMILSTDDNGELKAIPWPATQAAEIHVRPWLSTGLAACQNSGIEALGSAPGVVFAANERPTQTAHRVTVAKVVDGGAGPRVVARYDYDLDATGVAKDVGLSELVVINEASLLMLERGFEHGKGNSIR